MSDERHDIHFFVTGIQDGLKAVIKGALSYLKAIEVYGGPRDDSAIHEFIAQMTPDFPAALVVFGDTAKKLAPATSPALGAPRTFRVDCVFTVIWCDDNMRGEVERQRGDANSPGVIKMFSDGNELLSGRQLARRDDAVVVLAAGKKMTAGDVLLTYGPLTPTDDRYLELPGLTVYASDFETYFNWTEPDRRTAGTPVDDLIFGVGATSAPKEPGRRPGVEIR